MTPEQLTARQAVTELLGDLRLLAEQIGGPGLSAVAPPAGMRFEGVRDRNSLHRFVEEYRVQVLGAIELPAIVRAHAHATRSEYRELIALDQRLSQEPMLSGFAASSRRIGKAQLKRLRPLRDQRIVQRYLDAVDSGGAHGWHTVVFGLILGIYSLPLRQGLLHYAEQTLNGFINAGARSLHLEESDIDRLALDVSRSLPGTVEEALAASARFKLVRNGKGQPSIP